MSYIHNTMAIVSLFEGLDKVQDYSKLLLESPTDILQKADVSGPNVSSLEMLPLSPESSM